MNIRRRNQRLYQYIAGDMSDAELRTMLECVQDELHFRERGGQRQREEPEETGVGEEGRQPSTFPAQTRSSPPPAHHEVRHSSGTRHRATG